MAWRQINLCLFLSKKYTIAVQGGSFYWSRIHKLFDSVFAVKLWILLHFLSSVAIYRAG